MDELRCKVEELEAKLSMTEIALNDESRKHDQQMKRLGNELSTFYTDCMEAKNVQMTEELGKVLLDEIMDVFSILKAHGIELK